MTDEGSQQYQYNRRMQNNRFCEMKDVESAKGMDYSIYNTEDNKAAEVRGPALSFILSIIIYA